MNKVNGNMKILHSKAQANYLRVKGKFQLITQGIHQTVQNAKANGEEFTAEQMEELVQETGSHIALQELVQAEDELLEWARKAIKHEKVYKENKQSIDEAFQKADEDFDFRQHLLSLAMKINL